MSSPTWRPFNQETAPSHNAEPGIVITPGSNYAREMARWEQVPSKYTVGDQPGNPWVYRPFPKMLYRASRPPEGGSLACMAAPPDAAYFKDPREYERACQMADKFTNGCQKIVADDREYQQAMEGGWRESPKEALEHAEGRDRAIAQETAERQYQDRNLGDRARAEAEMVTRESGGEHQPEITRGKVAEAKDAKRRRTA